MQLRTPIPLMAVKKQPESNSGKLHETTTDWFREFLKHLELFMVGTGQSLAANAVTFDLSLAAMLAVKLALLESGMDNEQIRHLFGRVAFEDLRVADQLNWNAELNERRFQLIDRDIQGTLSQTEQLELAGLTQLMRAHVDSEMNLPLEGARKLHRLLTDFDSESTEAGR